MHHERLRTLLEGLKGGTVSVDDALESLRHLPFEELDCATVDHHRGLRQGFPEVVYGAGKSTGQIEGIVAALFRQGNNIMVTRLDADKAAAVKGAFPIPILGEGTILVISAGTSDLPVAAEALVTARMLGNEARHLCDVGVAGIHRLLARRREILEASVLIVVAGMEGALPSVVGGLVSRPVIAVPTSVGYGASFGGIAALLAMLNSCAAGVTVVNIDNGFGAAYAASLMNRRP
jgi:NCAIR mutase (PurE)-related protein